MDEITKLKAEVYDLIAQGETVQRLMAEKNQRIAQLLQEPKPTPATEAEVKKAK